MYFKKLSIEGLLLVTPNVFKDERGYFFESFNQNEFTDYLGEKISFVQDNQSKSKKEGVLDFKKNKHHIIKFLKKERNDLQVVTIKLYPKIKKIIDLIKNQDGCYFSRITGSGAACFGIFTNMKTAISTKKLIHTKFPNYWCAVSKTI